MASLTKLSFLLIVLLIVQSTYAQKITFGRIYINARHKQVELERLIEGDSSIQSAFDKIKGFFLPENGEKFILIGKKCTEGTYRSRYFNVFPTPIFRNNQRGLMLTRSDDPLYKWLVQYSGTILIFDEYTMDLSQIKDIYEIRNVLYQYKIGNDVRGKTLKFDPIKKTLFIDNSIYDPKDDQNRISETKILISYRHNKRVDELKNVLIAIASDQQRQSLYDIASNCPNTSPLCLTDLIEDLKNAGITVFTEDVVKWLKK